MRLGIIIWSIVFATGIFLFHEAEPEACLTGPQQLQIQMITTVLNGETQLGLPTAIFYLFPQLDGTNQLRASVYDPDFVERNLVLELQP